MAFHKKKHNEEVEENWLISYADMITLLICFFVLLLSVSEPKKDHMDEISEALKKSVSTAGGSSKIDIVKDAKEQLENLMVEYRLESTMSVNEEDKGLVIELSTSALYNSGSADLKAEAIPYLSKMADIIKTFPLEENLVNIIGHTDDAPIKTRDFPTNWELSAVRATRMVRFLNEHGLDEKMLRSAGFADTEPKVPNLDEFGNPIPDNRETNRRITIKIERAPERS